MCARWVSGSPLPSSTSYVLGLVTTAPASRRWRSPTCAQILLLEKEASLGLHKCNFLETLSELEDLGIVRGILVSAQTRGRRFAQKKQEELSVHERQAHHYSWGFRRVHSLSFPSRCLRSKPRKIMTHQGEDGMVK